MNRIGGFNDAAKSITPKPENIDYSKIFVGGLSWSSTEESLTSYFSQFGPVIKVEIMRDRVTGNPRGFCFIVFENDASVEKIMQHGKHTVDEKIVDVKRAQARGMAPPSIHHQGPGAATAPTTTTITAAAAPRQTAQNSSATRASSLSAYGTAAILASSATSTSAAIITKVEEGSSSTNTTLSPEQLLNKLFVGGLHLAIDGDEMKSYFEQYGTVVDSIVMMDQVQGRSRGFGFITYEEGSEGAQKAMAAIPHSIRDKYVEIKYAQPKAAGAATQTPSSTTNPDVGGSGGGMLNRSNINSEFYGLANAYGRSGWKAGYSNQVFG